MLNNTKYNKQSQVVKDKKKKQLKTKVKAKIRELSLVKFNATTQPRTEKRYKTESDVSHDKSKNRKHTIYRAKRNIFDIVAWFWNPANKFITFTYKDEFNTLDKQKVKNDINNCLARIEYYFLTKRNMKIKIDYVWVAEMHEEKQSYHVHMICNVPFIAQAVLQEIWGNGIVWICGLDSTQKFINSMQNMGTEDREIFYLRNMERTIKYLGKYFGKNFIRDYKEGEQLYYVSHGWSLEKVKAQKGLLTNKQKEQLKKLFYRKGFLKELSKKYKCAFEVIKYDVGKIRVRVWKFILDYTKAKEFISELLGEEEANKVPAQRRILLYK